MRMVKPDSPTSRGFIAEQRIVRRLTLSIAKRFLSHALLASAEVSQEAKRILCRFSSFCKHFLYSDSIFGTLIKLGAIKKILVATAGIVLGGLILLYFTSAYNEYAEVGYQLQGPLSFNRLFQSSLEITLNEENNGRVGAVPTSEIYVLNGTISQISINGVPLSQVSDYCWFNETCAVIGNLTIQKERTLSAWANIRIVPNEGVSSFSVRAQVSLASDWLHPRNEVHVVIPKDLVYNRTAENIHSLLG